MKTDVLQKFSLMGKRAVLTGAAGFFGRYFSQALVEAGVQTVFLLDQNSEGLLELKTECDSEKVVCFHVDQNDEGRVKDVFGHILSAGPVDVLINNSYQFGPLAGFGIPTGRVETATKAQVDTSLDSCWWALQATQLVAPAMKVKGSGSIINVASMYGLVAPNPALYAGRDYFNPVGYGMAKAALIAQTRYLASWLGPEIRVNAIAPGAIPNNERKSANSAQNEDQEFIDRLIDRTLLRRVGHPKDLIGPLVFLASDASSYMTGQTVVVDGGWTVT